MNRRGFTLLELIVANVLVAILLAGVLLVISTLGRESRIAGPGDPSEPIVNLLRWDLTNADTMQPLRGGRGFILIGHGSLDPTTRTPTSRRTRVIYEIRRRGETNYLIRSQSYLDDAVRPQRWEELVATHVNQIIINVANADQANLNVTELEIPDSENTDRVFLSSSVHIQISLTNGVIDRDLVLR
jgi:prepilin-type N-terminal cleavage/methylation domain-containing protein